MGDGIISKLKEIARKVYGYSETQERGEPETSDAKSDRVLKEYLGKFNLRVTSSDYRIDTANYDMSQRLRLAGMVAVDGNKLVVDLGSANGGMSYALVECGVKAVSTELKQHLCEFIRRHPDMGERVVRCDSFKLPFRGADALVSYMFLGMYTIGELCSDRHVGDIFEELSRSSDVIYSVELKREYSYWFGKDILDVSDIYNKLTEALPNFSVGYLGEFGTYTAGRVSPRIGFKFTKKHEGKSVRTDC